MSVPFAAHCRGLIVVPLPNLLQDAPLLPTYPPRTPHANLVTNAVYVIGAVRIFSRI